MKFSLIIPVYNVERYIERCIKSCANQQLSHKEFEIIAINDGSTDNSGRILQSLSKTYSNVIVINQENNGVSAARNVGVASAKKFKDTELFRLYYSSTHGNPVEKTPSRITVIEHNETVMKGRNTLKYVHYFYSWQFVVKREY